MDQWNIEAKVHEDLFKTIFEIISEQRPSVLNSATKLIASNSDYYCIQVPTPNNNAPKFSIIDPIVVGENGHKRLLLDYSIQINDIKFDIFPRADLNDNTFSFSLALNIGLGIPGDMVDDYLLFPESTPHPPDKIEIHLPFSQLSCYEVVLSCKGSSRWVSKSKQHYLLFNLTDFDFGTGNNEPLLSLVGQYIITNLNYVFFPSIAIMIDNFEIEVNPTSTLVISIKPSPVTPNPKLQSDVAAIYIDIV